MSKVVKGFAFAAAIYFTGGLLGAYGPAFFASDAFWTVANAMAINAFLSGVSSQFATKPRARVPETVEYSGTVEPRRIIYGERLVSGMNAIPPWNSGSSNKYLHQVLVIAGHAVNAITTVYFNGEAVGTISSVTGTSNDGKVTSGTFANKAWIRRYDGTQTTVDYILNQAFSTDWDSNHVGTGIAYAAIQFELDETVYKNGKPEVTFLVQGKKCYDTSLDSSPGNDPTNASYKAFTSNPTRCLNDFLTDTLGLGDAVTRIDWDMVDAAADICDESVAVPTSTTQDRYTCNLILYATDAYENSIAEITSCMLGSCLPSGESWRIRAGAWETPSFEITDSNVMGELELLTAFPYKDRWNGVRGTFIDPDNKYQEQEFPPTQDPDYVTDDGESVFKDVQYAGCVNVFEAQRAAVITGRKSRNRDVTTIPLDMSLWKVRPGDTGIATITELQWDTQQIRCEGWGFSTDGQVALRIRAENAADWDDPLESDYEEPLSVSTPALAPFTPDAPSALASTGTPRAVNLAWTAPTLMPTGARYQVFEYTGSTPFASASVVWEGFSTSCRLDKSDTTTRYYWVRVIMPDGTSGTEYPTSTSGISGGAVSSVEPYSDTTTFSITMGSAVSYVSVSVTVPTGEVWQVLVAGSVNATLGSGPSGAFRLRQDGTIIDGPRGWNSSNANLDFSTSFHQVVSLTAGTYAFDINGFNSSGGATFKTATITVTVMQR